MAYFLARKSADSTTSAAPKNLRMHPVRRSGEKGSAMIEFVLCTGLLIVPIFFGIISIGLSLVLANQVTEVCRDTGHMFAYGVDFSQPASQTLVTSQLAQGLNMMPSGGRGIIYLSTITYVDATSCVAAGLAPNTGAANSSNCPNINQTIVVKRLTIGNTGVQASTFAPAIPPGIINSNGDISSGNYMVNTSVRAANFAGVIPLSVGQDAYVSEMFLNPPLGGLWALFNTNVVTARSIF